MPEVEKSTRLEIGHVLFIDIVGYSLLLTERQLAVVETLNALVRSTPAVQAADAEGGLLKLPTGDGMALVFSRSPESPVACAIQLSEFLLGHSEIMVRMGIHSGPVSSTTDIDGRSNLAGAGLNVAQRVMDCGDAGHILVSQRVAEDLLQYERWRTLVHDLGEVEVKHGVRVRIWNLVTSAVGNPAVPSRILAVSAGSQPPQGRPESRRQPGAIAVLPLENRSPEPLEDFFVDGLTEALITDLAKVGGLRVISRGSIIGFRNSSQSAAEIGRALGVDTLLQGTVIRTGNRVRVSARLVDVETEEYLWADRYDRDLSDVLSLQDEVARAVAGAVGNKLLKKSARPVRKVDPQVYLLDLKARHHWHQRTEADFRAAIQLFEQAIALDPTYAPAHIGRADSLHLLSVYGMVPTHEVARQSRVSVRRALELDPESADAHRLAAFEHWQFEFAWEDALREYEQAIALSPNSPSTTYWFGVFLGVIGFFDRSTQMLHRAQQLDPLSLLIPSIIGWIHYFAHDFHRAMGFFDQVLSIDPNFHLALWFKGEALTELGEHAESVQCLERAYELSGRSSRILGFLGYGYGRAGRAEDAEAVLDELRERGRQAYSAPYFEALVLSGLGKQDETMDKLEQAFRERDSMLRDLKVDPPWDPMRTLPRFERLMQKMAYPES